MIQRGWRALLDSNQWPSASESAQGGSTTVPEAPLPSSNRTVSAEAGSQGTTFLPPVPKDFVTRLLPERRVQPPLLTVRQVAERLGVCTATVYRLCDEGHLLQSASCTPSGSLPPISQPSSDSSGRGSDELGSVDIEEVVL